MITLKQRRMLGLIDRYIQIEGIAPSYDEMMDALGLASKSGVNRLITALVERGYIIRIPARARALELTDKARKAIGSQDMTRALLLDILSHSAVLDVLPKNLQDRADGYISAQERHAA